MEKPFLQKKSRQRMHLMEKYRCFCDFVQTTCNLQGLDVECMRLSSEENNYE